MRPRFDARNSGVTGMSAIDILEESLYLLRQTPPGTIAMRLLGHVPFALGLLYFLTDMMRNPFAPERLPAESLAVAVLFLWKKVWQALFMARLHGQLSAAAPPPVNIARVILVQCALQPLAWVAMPLALLATLPFAWCVSFFRQVALLTALSEPAAVGQARKQSALWSSQNWQILGIVFLASILLLANIMIMIFLLPTLGRSFFGIEGDFARLGAGIFNRTTFAIALAITWLVIDPLLDAVYVLRYFYGVSLRTGEDLYARLKEILAQTAAAALLAAALLFIPTSLARAQTPSASEQVLDAERLDQAIDKTVRRPEFAWRTPRVERTEPPGKWVNWLRGVGRTINDGFSWLGNKIEEWFRSRQPADGGDAKSSSKVTVETWMIAAGLLLLAGLVAALLRGRAKKPLHAEAVEPVQAAPIDLADESLTADRMPENSWRALADELTRNGEYRKALRALYLAGLNYLSTRGLISLHPKQDLTTGANWSAGCALTALFVPSCRRW